MKKLLENKGAVLEDILNIEAELTITIPSQLKEFLLLQNGGCIRPSFIFKRFLDDGTQNLIIDEFLSIEEIKSAYFNGLDIEEFKGNLAFVQNMGASVVSIGIEKENFGKIFVYDGDFGLTEQANSLEEFLEQLQKDV
ncbi:MAG: SMI1/KNR4 family protein [Breznakibacter sp.]